MTEIQFKQLMEKLDAIEHDTNQGKEAAYETEQVGNKLDQIIELLEKLLKSKKTGY